MKMCNRILSILLVLALCIGTSSLAFADSVSSKNDKEKFITQHEFIELLQKYDMEIVNDSTVSELGLVEDSNKPKLNLDVTYSEMESILQNLKSSFYNSKPTILPADNNVSLNNTISMNSMNIDKEYSMLSTSGNSSRTIEDVETVDTGLTDLILRCSVAISYTYNWINLPGEPYKESNFNITSYSQGTISQTNDGGYTRISGALSSSTTKLSSTSVRQSYSGTVDQYIPVSFYWVKIGSMSISGNVAHSL